MRTLKHQPLQREVDKKTERPAASIEAEQSLLGSLLLSSAVWQKVSKIVTRADFSVNENALLWEGIKKLAEAGKPTDIVTVGESMEAEGTITECGGWAYLGTIAALTPSADNAYAYAVIVKRKSYERQRQVAIDKNDHHKAAAITAAIDAVEEGWGTKRLPTTEITIEDLTNEPEPPRFIITDFLPQDIFIRNATGGTGKSTLALIEAIHIIMGEPLWGMPIATPGPVVYITGEDGDERLRWRLFNIINQMGLPRSDREYIAENLHIVNLVGTGHRLVEQDRSGNLSITRLADDLCEQFASINPTMMHFDPLIKFAGSEQGGNEAADMLINAAMRIRRNLGCGVGFSHHVSKDVFRTGTVDHLSGRGPSAYGDGARAVYSLIQITRDMAAAYTGAMLYQDDLEQGQLLAHVVTKLTDAQRPPAPMLLRRRGWLFERLDTPSKDEIRTEMATKRQDKALERLNALTQYLETHEDVRMTVHDLQELHTLIGMGRNELRTAIKLGIATGRLVERDQTERRGPGKYGKLIGLPGDKAG